MPTRPHARLRHVDTPDVRGLDTRTFEGLGCARHGVVVMQGAASWQAHERGFIELPTPEGNLVIPIRYDDREAPFAATTDGCERNDLLVSLSDEDDYLACAWAQTQPGSPLVGLGVDLSSSEHFEGLGNPRRRELALAVLTEGERRLASSLAQGGGQTLAESAVFAAKEAAFKATSQPLRRWYDTHDEELLFEVRHFVMHEPGIERGDGRNGAAQAAMERMGISRIAIHHVEVCGMALVTGVALRA